MAKGFLFKFVIGLAAVSAAVLWLLSVLVPDNFGWFSGDWAVVIVAGVTGLAFLIRGFADKSAVALKKLYVYFGVALLGVAVFGVIGALAITADDVILPIIAIVITVALLLGFVAVGGKKWDGGDNEKAGYKNYYERKKEQEEAAKAGVDKDDE